MKHKLKPKTDLIEIKEICKRVHIRLSFPFCLHVEIIPANMGVRQVQEYYNILGFYI